MGGRLCLCKKVLNVADATWLARMDGRFVIRLDDFAFKDGEIKAGTETRGQI